MQERFFAQIDPELRPPEEQIHFPTTEAIGDYSARIEDLGGADVCYGGIGWCGHIAFWESHLGHEFEGDLDAYKQAGARLVELHPMTIMQNALHSFGGDWSWVPPKANTIGPREILGARHRSFWLDGDLGGRRLMAALHRPARRPRPSVRVHARLDPADDAERLHDPRRRRRRRRDQHGLTLAAGGGDCRSFGSGDRAHMLMNVRDSNLSTRTPPARRKAPPMAAQDRSAESRFAPSPRIRLLRIRGRAGDRAQPDTAWIPHARPGDRDVKCVRPSQSPSRATSTHDHVTMLRDVAYGAYRRHYDAGDGLRAEQAVVWPGRTATRQADPNACRSRTSAPSRR